MIRLTLGLAVLLFTFSIYSHAVELTPEYLEGKWCFAYVDVRGEQEPENKNWIFNKDGTFTYQVSSSSSKMGTGKYEIDGNKIRLKPVFILDCEVLSVAEDEFVFKFFGDVHFIRGECM